jgi:hypothetical protein
MAEENDGFTVDVKRGVHMFAECEDLACVEFTFMLKFFMVKEDLEKLISSSPKAKTVCLVKVVAYLVIAPAKNLFDLNIIAVFNFFSEPLGNLLRQGPLRFVLRRQV